MSIENKQINCALCHAYLFPEDDVVYCPECGAPHHRECYNKIGKCALEEFHGTENQYDKLKRAMEEKEAKEAKEKEAEAIPEPEQPFGNFISVDFLGGVKPDLIIEDGVTAKEAAKFVMSNTMRYIPKFAKRKKASWNFLAFLSPCAWFLSRKMYKWGIVTGAVQLVSSLLTLPYQNILASLGIEGSIYSYQYAEQLAQHMDKFSPTVIAALFVGGILSALVSILSGVYGDWIYRNHTINTIKEIKTSSAEVELDYRKKGGVNFILFFVGLFGLSYILNIIAILI